MTDKLLKASEVAQRWGISLRTLRRQVATKTIRVQPCTRIGRSYRWRESDVDADIRDASLGSRSSSPPQTVKLH
jgi:excisionase family DNA binding protein